MRGRRFRQCSSLRAEFPHSSVRVIRHCCYINYFLNSVVVLNTTLLQDLVKFITKEYIINNMNLIRLFCPLALIIVAYVEDNFTGK